MAIVQSNYIPWRGYFDLIGLADEFILLDDVQYTQRDWRNRNRIKTSNGTTSLTVPVEVKGKHGQLINRTTASDPGWAGRRLASFQRSYRAAPCYDQYGRWLAELYNSCTAQRISDIDEHFIRGICAALGLNIPITRASDYSVRGRKSERLLALCRQASADVYPSGPAARGYLDTDLFLRHGIQVRWMDYSGYRPYRQMYGEFVPDVTILDLILNEGPNAPSFLKSGWVSGT